MSIFEGWVRSYTSLNKRRLVVWFNDGDEIIVKEFEFGGWHLGQMNGTCRVIIVNRETYNRADTAKIRGAASEAVIFYELDLVELFAIHIQAGDVAAGDGTSSEIRKYKAGVQFYEGNEAKETILELRFYNKYGWDNMKPNDEARSVRLFGKPFITVYGNWGLSSSQGRWDIKAKRMLNGNWYALDENTNNVNAKCWTSGKKMIGKGSSWDWTISDIATNEASIADTDRNQAQPVEISDDYVVYSELEK